MNIEHRANETTAADDGIWVLGETRPSGEISPTAFELSAKARELTGSLSKVTGRSYAVTVLFLLDAGAAITPDYEDAGKVGLYGADRVYRVSMPGLPFDRARCARILAHLAGIHKPQIVLSPATAFGRAVMPYAAALLETGLTADCTGLGIEPESGLLLQTRPAIGGNIMATIKTPNHTPQMATVRPRTFHTPKPDEDAEKLAEVIDAVVPENIAEPTVQTVEIRAFGDLDDSSGSSKTLQEKDAIVSGGKGLRRAEGFELIKELASLIDAGVGASRPTVEMKWISYPHQVGLSGQVVSPRVYIAAGLSGSVQHLAGMQTAEKIVSINRDPEAQIVGISDVAICGDLYEVIPMLIEKIKKRKGHAE